MFSRASRTLARAESLARENELERAVEILENLADKLGKNAPFHVQKALLLARAGKFDRAEKEIDRAVELDSSNPACHVFRALVRADLGNLDPAADSLEKTRELDPGNTLADELEILVLLGKGRAKEAAGKLKKTSIGHIETLIRLAPKIEVLALKTAHKNLDPEKEMKTAARSKKGKEPEKSTSQSPSTPQAELKKGFGLFWNEKYEKASKHLGTAAMLTRGLEGISLFLCGRRKDAFAPLEEVYRGWDEGGLAMGEIVYEAVEYFGEALFDKGEIARAVGLFRRLENLEGAEPGPRSNYFLGLADCFAGEKSSARARFIRTIDEDPTLPAGRMKHLAERIG